ncbi:hypothetical protein [Citreimonas sp.]|uniref:hypothetical protein n=1 Tax=Citreimonas sp. TaxID=3036715 RepID=UPI0035C7F5E5
MIRILAEIESRFEMKPMQAVGSGFTIAKRTGGRIKHPRNAAAWYSPHFNAMGWNKVGLSTEPWMSAEASARTATSRQAAHGSRVSRLPDGPAKEIAGRVEYKWTVVEAGPDYPRSVAIHESGHRLDFNDRAAFDEAVRGWNSGWQYAVSEYGSKNRNEFVAESFVLYMLGEEHHWRIKPELLALFKRKDRFNASR